VVGFAYDLLRYEYYLGNIGSLVQPLVKLARLRDGLAPSDIVAISRSMMRMRFKWVGQVAAADKSSFYKLSSRADISVKSLDDARKYVIGANIDSDKHQFLVKNGFESLSLVSDQSLSPKQLRAGHIDLWIMHDVNMEAIMRDAKFPAGEIVKVFTAYESRPFMAFSNSTSDEIVARAVAAYNELKAEGGIAAF
jgi:polar amino acid transport system substrate-binding protein